MARAGNMADSWISMGSQRGPAYYLDKDVREKQPQLSKIFLSFSPFPILEGPEAAQPVGRRWKKEQEAINHLPATFTAGENFPLDGS